MILDDIINRKKLTLEESKYTFNLLNLYSKVQKDSIANFRDAMLKDGLSIIGEVKKASPSRGIIKENFNPIEIAKQYEKAVDAISVLTEEHYFMGSANYLKDIHSEVKLPIIRKDFIISPLQIFEARELGASAVLLIAAVLNKKQILKEFLNIIHGLDMYALVETHNENELELALESNAEIIGINNRNLNDFSEDINTTIKLSTIVPKDKIIISESSIHTVEDITILKQANINGILVGESFMKTDNIIKKAQEFKRAYEC